MNEPMSPAPASGGWNLKLSILFGAVLALLAANIYLFVQLDRTRTELSKFRDTTSAEIANLREASSVSSAAARRHIDTLKDELEAARRQATMAVGQAKSEALARAEQLTKRLAEEQQKQNRQITGQISEVKQAATETAAKVEGVSSDVSAVKSDLGATKSELEKTIADLKRVNGDMGVMSGLIATNGKELNALKALGDRNYYEFSLKKAKQPTRIGDITMLLKKTDQKKNKYTVQLVADDKTVEKKDKNVNEPVQFYVARARQPYELVVNEVKKDLIVGYLATPKVMASR